MMASMQGLPMGMFPMGLPKQVDLEEAMGKILKEVEKAKPEDRLALIILLRKEIGTIHIVLDAWSHWINTLEIIDLVKEDELTKMVHDFYDMLEILMYPSAFLSNKIREKAEEIVGDTSPEELKGGTEISVI